jgi:hypothetical protein
VLKYIALAVFLAFAGVAVADDAALPPPSSQAQIIDSLQNALAAAKKSPTPVVVQTSLAAPDNWAATRGWIITVLVPGILSFAVWLMKNQVAAVRQSTAKAAEDGAVVKEAAQTNAITTSAYGFGAVLAQYLTENGVSAKDLKVNSPEIAPFLDQLIQVLPDYVAAIKPAAVPTRDRLAGIIIKGAAIAQGHSGAAVDTSVPVEKKPEQIAFEAAGGTNWDTQSDAMKNYWLQRVMDQSAAETAAPKVPEPPPTVPPSSKIGLPIMHPPASGVV